MGSTTTNSVVVSEGVTATITLDNVSIYLSADAANTCAFDIRPGATVELILANVSTNILKSKDTSAGIQAPAGAKLTIRSAVTQG